MLRLLQKFLPPHVREHLTQHIGILLMGTWRAGELLYYTLQSRQFRLQWLLRTRCPNQQCRKALLLVQTGQEGRASLYREVAETRLPFTQPQWACLKDFLFLKALQIGLLLFCEVKQKLMTDTTL